MQRTSRLVAGLIGLAALITACTSPSESTMDRHVMDMMMKMGVPGASAKPEKQSMALDCPPVRGMLDQARQAKTPLSPQSKQLLNAWAQWCGVAKLP